METIKNKIQRLVRGYADEDVNNLGDFILDTVRAPLKTLVKFEAEHGNTESLPEEFKTDPAMWLLILQKIEYSFESSWKEKNDWTNRIDRNMSEEQKVEHNKKVQEGFELFGKYLIKLNQHELE